MPETPDSFESTGSPSISITTYFKDKQKAVEYVNDITQNFPQGSPLTTTIIQAKSGGFSATIVIGGSWADIVIQNCYAERPTILQ